MSKFTPRYSDIAQKIVTHSYVIDARITLEVRQLLEIAGDEQEVEHILCEDLGKQAIRLTHLDRALERILADYEFRRLRCPLVRTSNALGSKSYTPAFANFVSGAALGTRGAPTDQASFVRFRATPEVRDQLYRLTPRQFEDLAGAILTIIGCTNVTVTQSSKDDGVDAVAELLMKHALQARTPLHRVVGRLSFLVYVQAKRYSLSNPVRQEAVQQLEGSWVGVRNAFHNGELAPERAAALRRADYRSADPVLLVIMTTGRFSPGALVKAEDIGVITLDGEQIAQLLIEAAADPDSLGVEPMATLLGRILSRQ